MKAVFLSIILSLASTGYCTSQIAESRPEASASGGDVGIIVPNLDEMTAEERAEYLRMFGRLSGISDEESAKLESWQERVADGVLRDPVWKGNWTRHADEFSGEEGAQLGCAINMIVQPQTGACLENPANRAAYEAYLESQKLDNGRGVELPPVLPSEAELLPDFE